MAKNISNIHIYGDEAGGVWVAPKGTTGPVDLTAPPVGFAEVGWISEDGISEEASLNANTFRAWQGAKIVKRKISENDRTFSFQALEENAVVRGLKYRGQQAVVTGGVATTTVKDQTANDDRAWIFDMVDGTVTKRFVVPAGSYELSGTTQYTNSDLTVHEFTVTPIGDYFEITNNPALTATV